MDSEDVESLLVALGIGHFDRTGYYHEQDALEADLIAENEQFVDRYWDDAANWPEG